MLLLSRSRGSHVSSFGKGEKIKCYLTTARWGRKTLNYLLYKGGGWIVGNNLHISFFQKRPGSLDTDRHRRGIKRDALPGVEGGESEPTG